MFLAVTQRVIKNEKTNEIRDSLDQRLTTFLLKNNFKPIFIPSVFNKKKEKLLINFLKDLDIKGLILTGGENFGINRNRDFTEILLIKWAIKKKIPVLGICRGMQLICRYYGSTLKKVSSHVRKRHQIINTSKNFKFDKIVNSYHNFSIKKCPKQFSVSAYSKDGNIEAVESMHLNLFGIMWHPEREKVFSKNDLINIKKIFKKK